MEKLYEVPKHTVLWRGTVVRIHKWFKCPAGFYAYDLMFIDGHGKFSAEKLKEGGSSFDVICINYKAGALNVMSPLECNVDNSQAVTAEYLFEKVLEFLNAIKGRKHDFTADEVKDHIFVYAIKDVKEINPEVISFTGNEKYNDI